MGQPGARRSQAGTTLSSSRPRFSKKAGSKSGRTAKRGGVAALLRRGAHQRTWSLPMELLVRSRSARTTLSPNAAGRGNNDAVHDAWQEWQLAWESEGPEPAVGHERGQLSGELPCEPRKTRRGQRSARNETTARRTRGRARHKPEETVARRCNETKKEQQATCAEAADMP
ncbi:hypothetical protein ERJ75_000618200 [Trypanosoma vivax]|nr:hypothetical protein ERJ75_000618200 [Trypanosoma vivax]